MLSIAAIAGILAPMTDEEAIRAVIARWMQATREGDTAAVLELMTDDAVFLSAGREPFGKEVFRVASAATKGMAIDGDHEVLEMSVSGDQAWVRSHLVVRVAMPDGTNVVRKGPCLTIFRKGATGWQLARDANLVA